MFPLSETPSDGILAFCIYLRNLDIPPKTNITMEKLTNAFPIENGDFPMGHVSYQECIWTILDLLRYELASNSPGFCGLC